MGACPSQEVGRGQGNLPSTRIQRRRQLLSAEELQRGMHSGPVLCFCPHITYTVRDRDIVKVREPSASQTRTSVWVTQGSEGLGGPEIPLSSQAPGRGRCCRPRDHAASGKELTDRSGATEPAATWKPRRNEGKTHDVRSKAHPSEWEA